jgi:plastocyanin
VLLLGAVVALAAAGCGGNDDGGSSSSSTSTPAASSSGGAVAIKMQNTVKVGQKITWTNDDSTDHNVTADSGADFKSDNFGKDGTFEFTPDKAGTIKYECTIHPGMTATLTVQ